MSAREPDWWYGSGADGWLPRALAPAGFVYGALTTRRMRAAPSHRSPIPVIAVGNFTAGGTGKTPFVRVVLGMLRDAGHRPVVLSRGYGGSQRGPTWVDVATHTASDVGDEPLLLSTDAPVMVSRDRAAGARTIEMSPLPSRATVIVMDDGLQNPALAKSLSVALIDYHRGFGNGRCIPAGPLRAPLSTQVAFADALLLNRGTIETDDAQTAHPSIQRLTKTYPGLVWSAEIAPVSSHTDGAAVWAGRPVVAYAGIGAPQKFFATLSATAADVRAALPFPDHHVFTPADARQLLQCAREHDAVLVTTEKDYARLRGLDGDLAVLRQSSRVLAIRMVLDTASTASLRQLLAEKFPL